FELAAKYPSIRFATHFTGILLDWIETHHPEHLEKLRAMVGCGQIEMISGGFFEPILSVIPPQDQQAQIELLTERIEDLFGTTPIGLWLAERVWEQPLASVLREAGIRYVLLDDTHFLHAGLNENDLNGYYLTEDNGKTLAVFPISKELRYTIPFRPVDDTIQVLREAASESGTNIVTFADDGEKFGVWPRTFDHVYGDGTDRNPGWLEELFRKLSENANWITMLPPGEALARVKPRGRIYLPNASYSEMMQWSLPTAEANQLYENFIHQLDEDKARWEQYRPFVRGGYWRNFFAKYPESNHLHKHTLRTSARIQKLDQRGNDVAEPRLELLRSQCNDPYWHGVFGGIYLSNLRHANYSALLKADALLDEAEGLSGIRMEQTDFDCDGAEEIILESHIFSLYVKPSLGGMIAEIDFKPRCFNATNIISRRREAYHSKIVGAGDGTHHAASIHEGMIAKEAGLEKLLIYDPYHHGCLIEHFLSESATVDDLRTMRFEELGNFVTSAFEWGWNKEKGILRLTRNGNLQGNAITVMKELALSDHGSNLKITYAITNESQAPLRLRFASEWAFNLLAGSAPDRYYESNGKRFEWPELNSIGSLPGVKNIRLVDECLKLAIELRATDADEIIRFPIESISLSEGGFERIYQGSIVLPIWNIELAPGQIWKSKLTVMFELLP
ncbi:MAG TPA: alpha-amylase/4-alpha-glucanotransferase domain-containing protein, partial [Candidatus Kapabacteria bacterium]|nr:alpha-amylase/4-alpha-glucanotransferase domain-containing protein [Candidatus Kapabacteria bacterium]